MDPTSKKPARFDAPALATWRDRMGYTRADAAEALGCSADQIEDWEHGVVPTPRYIGLACAALALGIEVQE